MMVIDCSQCEFHLVACDYCLVTVVTENDRRENSRKDTRKGNRDDNSERHALAAQELRALNVLATAGLVPPLRYRPAPVGELADAIVAL
ncbi:MAG TPA: hypothetical protein VGI21_26615 [Streptosporangiaceae bacterium]